MSIIEEAPETAAEFLARLGKTLEDREGHEAELAKIVSDHILKAEPADDCVQQALTAITELATARATAPEENGDG